MIAIAMMEVERASLLLLNALATDGAETLLLSQDCSTKRGRGLLRHLAVPVFKVRRPGRIKGIGGRSDLEMTLRLNRQLHPEELAPGAGIGKLARLPPADGESSGR